MGDAVVVHVSVEAVVAPACFWLLLSADIMSGEENVKSGSEGREAGPRQSGRSPETGSGHLVTQGTSGVRVRPHHFVNIFSTLIHVRINSCLGVFSAVQARISK